MKYRITLLAFMAAMVAVIVWFHNYAILASAGLLAMGLAIYYERWDTSYEKAHPSEVDEDGFHGVSMLFKLSGAAALVAGVGAKVSGFGWWSTIGFAVLGFMVYFGAVICAYAASKEPLNERRFPAIQS